MFVIEILAALLTLWCVYLTTKGKLLSWAIGIWAVCLYAFVFWEAKLYADFILQGIFAVQGIIGFILWLRKGEVKDNTITKFERLTNSHRLFYLVVGLSVYLLAAFFFNAYTGAAVPYIDSLVATFSLLANYLLMKRKIENWWVWIFVNCVYIGLFMFKGLFISAGLYTILLVLAVKGLRDWQKKMA
jgi:nicotinamide mononucleotide transporter